ncbi:aminotransferase class III-fold pyridoxal phosphate-dependent enzyme [Solwaraspora sp. WMMD937]|uniref:aminotransferase class III-fold pyridoxal phosphate-dependent enzyme n=1 Tax=Solwaraspora sp. WMMD937 TaxID=3016090 RepID=UPI00249B6389|nr:aminotransferase class III-fold pyridoxal phosphate-dependent enzyme [Solwaraspora sp. WMMD937]WFE20720.1 aminotransferase class III-fold pyridoxal phosphate-dependent enzyme [Solwaraspora sp. WMMD937]
MRRTATSAPRPQAATTPSRTQPGASSPRRRDAKDRYGSSDAAGAAFLASVRAAIDDIESSGDRRAGLILDTSFSSDGIYPGDPGMIRAAVELVRERGGVVIADEVQPGFARTGESFWGHQRHGLDPDIVTTGKPMGNGFPIAAVAARSEVLAPFAGTRPYFNTFGGNPVAIAAAQAVLDVIRDDELQSHALVTGESLRAGLRELAGTHPAIGDVRGVGLYTGVELVPDGTTRGPATGLALDVIEELRARRVLTSVCGPANNVLKLRPPLPFAASDIPQLIEALDGALTASGA